MTATSQIFDQYGTLGATRGPIGSAQYEALRTVNGELVSLDGTEQVAELLKVLD